MSLQRVLGIVVLSAWIGLTPGLLYALAPQSGFTGNANNRIQEETHPNDAQRLKAAHKLFDDDFYLLTWSLGHDHVIETLGMSALADIARALPDPNARFQVFEYILPEFVAHGAMTEVEDAQLFLTGLYWIQNTYSIYREDSAMHTAILQNRYFTFHETLGKDFREIWPWVLETAYFISRQEPEESPDIGAVQAEEAIKALYSAGGLRSERGRRFVRKALAHMIPHSKGPIDDRLIDLYGAFTTIIGLQEKDWDDFIREILAMPYAPALPSKEEHKDARASETVQAAPSALPEIRAAMEKLQPVFGVQTQGQVHSIYQDFQSDLGTELVRYWDGIVEMMLSSSGQAHLLAPASGNALATYQNLQALAKAYGARFSEVFEPIHDVVLSLRVNANLFLMPLRELAQTDLSRADDLLALYRKIDPDKREGLGTLIRWIIRDHPGEWRDSWPRVRFIFGEMNTQALAAFLAIHEDYGFADPEELERFLTHFKDDAFSPEVGANAGWLLHSRWPHLAGQPATRAAMMEMLTPTQEADPQPTDIMSLLAGLSIRDIEQFETAVAQARRLLSLWPPSAIGEVTARLRMIEPEQIQPEELGDLYALMLYHRLPLTKELVSEWRKFSQSEGPTVRPGERPLTMRFAERYHQAGWEKVTIPAVLKADSAEQARRIADFLDQNPTQTTFLQIGPIVADGKVLRPPPDENRARAYRLARRFGTDKRHSIDNLFLVAVRNPLALREETIHGRSFTSETIRFGAGVSPKAPADLVGKGVGVPDWQEKEGVVSAYAAGVGVHKFTGGILSPELRWSHQAEQEMKKGLEELLADSHWRALAEYFQITPENLFIHHMAEFRPLALPVYFRTEDARSKLAKDILPVPASQDAPPFGLQWVRPRALLRHLGLNTFTLAGEREEYAALQRIAYYTASDSLRISEWPRTGRVVVPLFGGGEWHKPEGGETEHEPLPEHYNRILSILGFDMPPQADFDPDKPFLGYKDSTGARRSAHYLRQHLFLEFLARTAMLARVLHQQGLAGANDWGTIFSSSNLGPLVVFDYDTVQVAGHSPEVEEWDKAVRRDRFALFEGWQGTPAAIPTWLAKLHLDKDPLGVYFKKIWAAWYGEFWVKAKDALYDVGNEPAEELQGVLERSRTKPKLPRTMGQRIPLEASL